MYAMSVEVFGGTLGQLTSLLDKGLAWAAERQFDATVLGGVRLAPDMLPLSRQVQLASDFAKNSSARLAGREPPRFDDDETDLPALKHRIVRTLDYLGTLEPAAFEGSETRMVEVPLRDRTLSLPGLPFLQRWALPNFFFHATTTYALLRHNGVAVGKRDFLGPV